MQGLNMVAHALDRAWEQLTCICNDGGTPDSGICDCAVAQVGAALDILRAEAERVLGENAVNITPSHTSALTKTRSTVCSLSAGAR